MKNEPEAAWVDVPTNTWCPEHRCWHEGDTLRGLVLPKGPRRVSVLTIPLTVITPKASS